MHMSSPIAWRNLQLVRHSSLWQALKDDYQLTLVGHSLGAGAAALLAMMLKARGITNMHCYAFAPPMCCEPDLASTCSDCITSVIFRDDIISRYGLLPESSSHSDCLQLHWIGNNSTPFDISKTM